MTVESMAYRNDVPWLGLGEPVPANASVSEMLKVSKIDWTVSKREVFARASDVREHRLYNDFIGLDNRVAIVRDKDQRVYSVVSDRYNPVQNSEVVEFFREYCEAGSMTLETLGALKHGAVIWGLASIDREFELANRDKVKGYLLLANSHDGSMSFSARFTSIRAVCVNTLSTAFQGRADWSMRHSRKFTEAVAEDAKRSLGLANERFEELERQARILAQHPVHYGLEKLDFATRIAQPEVATVIATNRQKFPLFPTNQEVDEVLAKIAKDSGLDESKAPSLGPKVSGILDAIDGAPTTNPDRETYWDLVNGVTYYADHVAGKTRDSGLTSAWFGSSARLKADALETALAMAI